MKKMEQVHHLETLKAIRDGDIKEEAINLQKLQNRLMVAKCQQDQIKEKKLVEIQRKEVSKAV